MYTERAIAAVIPIYYPSSIFAKVWDSLVNQTYKLSSIIIIDSTPEEKTIVNWEKYLSSNNDIPVKYVQITEKEFDHGGTRNYGMELAGEVDAVLLITQDAVLYSDCLEKMVDYINKQKLVAAFARQLPRSGADRLESLEREKFYPPVSRTTEGAPLNLDDVFFSNTCSLINKDAWKRCGGFPKQIITAEDMIFASKLLSEGYRIGYCAEALVIHSHAIRLTKGLKRYFDTGVMHTDWKDQIPIESAGKKGKALLMFQIKHLIKFNPLLIGLLIMNVLEKLIGYKLGRHYQLLPNFLRIGLSQNRNYWLKR